MDPLAITLFVACILVLLNDTRITINKEKKKINVKDDRDLTETIYDE